MKSVNLTEDFVSKDFVMNQIFASGGYLFEISTYELEGDHNWLETALAIAIGVASIATGLWMITAYGASSICSDIGFVASNAGSRGLSAISNFLGNHLKAKGMATAVALATAGLLYVANMVPFIQSLGFIQKGVDGILNTAADGTKLVLTSMAVQRTTAAVGAGLNHVGKNS